MTFGISTQIYRDLPLTLDLLESIRKAGYDRIELFCNRPHMDFHDRTVLRSIARWFRENELPAPSMHLPFVEQTGPKQRTWISALAAEERLRESAIDELKRSLELIEWLPLDHVVMHLGNPDDRFSPVLFEYAYAAIALVRNYAGVPVMIENIPNEISTIDRILEFKSAAQVPEVGICYDTGHGHLQKIKDGFEHIHAMHVHDNHGKDDEHLWPFEGTINWPGLIEKLHIAKYKGPFIFETRGDLPKGHDVRKRLEDLWNETR